MTRVQKERFSDPIEYERTKNAYVLKNKMLEGTKENMRVLHPLPRVNEIDQDVDENPKAYYFTQALNGVFIRQAIITSILGLK
jgi:aspartate carbamoyltransferase catalytic subunit